MSDTVLKVEGLYKKFTKSLKRSMLYGTADMLRGMVGAHVSEELRKGEFWALQDINFELKRGEAQEFY
jgi:lipopolysaccharide transport system ATP-binding protein